MRRGVDRTDDVLGTVEQQRRFTREEYERLAELGILHPDERVELVDGAIYVMTPQSPEHSGVTCVVKHVVVAAFGAGHFAREHSPIPISDVSMPEPDVVIVRGEPRDFITSYPTTPLLLIEVSKSSLAFDRGKKLFVYAKASIPEYWIVNLVEELLEVYRDPCQDGTYATTLRLGRRESLKPLHAQHAVCVNDLLPPPRASG